MMELKENSLRFDHKDGDKRKWLRFEFASPVLFRLISIEEVGPEIESNVEREGRMLDISAGGALLTTDRPVAEGNLISLNLNLKGLKIVRGILGKVKRVEESEQGDFLMGIEFCSLETLPLAQQKAMTEKAIDSFDKKVKGVISEYILAETKKLREKVKA